MPLCLPAIMTPYGHMHAKYFTQQGVVAAGAYTFQITITKTYNTANLFEDLKSLYKMAGVKGQPVAFIFTCAVPDIIGAEIATKPLE